jgi:hypothetical protein
MIRKDTPTDWAGALAQAEAAYAATHDGRMLTRIAALEVLAAEQEETR